MFPTHEQAPRHEQSRESRRETRLKAPSRAGLALLLAAFVVPVASAGIIDTAADPVLNDGWSMDCNSNTRNFAGHREAGCWPREIKGYTSMPPPDGTRFHAEIGFVQSFTLNERTAPSVEVCVEGQTRYCSPAGFNQDGTKGLAAWSMDAADLPRIGDFTDNGEPIRAWLVQVMVNGESAGASWLVPAVE